MWGRGAPIASAASGDRLLDFIDRLIYLSIVRSGFSAKPPKETKKETL
jgi:hypothetical protein